MRLRRILLICLGLVVVGLGVAGVWRWRAGQAKPATAATFATERVKRGELIVNVSNTGTVSGLLQQDVRSEVAGTAVRVPLDVGDQVKEGAVVVQLSNDELVSQLQQTRLDLKVAEAKLQEMRNPVSRATQADLNLAQLKVEQARRTLDLRKADSASLVIKSPIAGTVTALSLVEGQQVTAGALVGTVVDLDRLQFQMAISQDNISRIKLGDQATIAIGKDSRRRIGTVAQISAIGYLSGGTTVYDVYLDLDGPANDPAVQPGFTGWAVFGTSRATDPTIEGKGTVVPRQTADLRPAVAATVQEIKAKVNTRVAPGDVLVVLTNDSLAVQVKQAELDLISAETNLQQLQAPPVSATPSELAAQEAKVEQLRLQVDTQQRNVDKLAIRSPISGTIIARNVNPGDKVSAGGSGALFTVADYSHMQIVVPIDELDIGKIKLGQRARATVEALANRAFAAQVTKIAPSGTTTQGVTSYNVTLTVPEASDLKPGMTANVTILVDRRENALLVPIEAVRRQGERATVQVVGSDGQAKTVRVRVGLMSEAQIEILEGLQEGDAVVVGQINQLQLRGTMPFGGGGQRPPGAPGGGGPAGGGTRTPQR